MKKAANRRAFFVYLLVCAVYVVVAFKLPEKFAMRRIATDHKSPAQSSSIYGHNAEVRVTEETAATESETLTAPGPDTTRGAATRMATDASRNPESATPPKPSDPTAMEPSLFIAVPVVCHALKAGWIERDGLIFFKNDAYNNGSWKKPLDIIKDRDEEGIRSILGTIGKDRLREFLTKEGITAGKQVSPEDVMLGRGYTVPKKTLLALYERHVGDLCDELIPFYVGATGIVKGRQGFQMVSSRTAPRAARPAEEREWLMPNLVNLPVRAAVEKLAAHTSKIRIYGNGVIVSQSPRAFERLRGEAECSVQGRLYSE
jgi:hypothetical protein